MFEAVEISREITGSGQNLLLCGDAYQQQPALSALAGQVQAVYIDPPFMTGETFTRRRRFGTSGWKTGRPMPEYPAYIDRFADTKEYLELLRSLIECAKDLLKPTGVLYLHLDWRTSAYARLLCDEIFGEDIFLNEIVWSYESGGRAKKYFSRKHDTILLSRARRTTTSTCGAFRWCARSTARTTCAAAWTKTGGVTAKSPPAARSTATTMMRRYIRATCGATSATCSRKTRSARVIRRRSR